MEEKIQQILKDIYMMDESLRANEKDLVKIIEEMLRSNPDTKFDENFARQLRSEVLRRAESIKRPRRGRLIFFNNVMMLNKFAYAVGCVILFILLMAPIVYHYDEGAVVPISPGGKIDDWKYNPAGEAQDSVFSFSQKSAGGAINSAPASAPSFSSENLGFAAGGAKDINNFRENIKNNYLPLSSDITYEGLFYDYYFDTAEEENQCEKLFCPSYSYAISKDPFSKNDEYYLSVGLNSGIKESDFKRKKLNLVIVLDISGSMGSPFDRYYYDQFGGENKSEKAEDDEDYRKKKIEIAAKSVAALVDHLNDDDRFGMVLFDDGAYLAKPMDLVGKSDMKKIKDHILEIKEKGGTEMSAGMKMGAELFADFGKADQNEYENRIIFLTDAMPNLGETGENALSGMLKKNSENKIYTTFIGIGVDFNTELVEYITKIRGANYYSVHSAEQFKERMDDEFEYMVTPLVFNLSLFLDAEGYRIEKVYGSPEADEATGEIMKINTLFPSKTEDSRTKGGIVLLKLKKLSQEANLKLRVVYENREGEQDGGETSVEIKEGQEFFGNNGTRKGVLLARYADLVKNWINDERRIFAAMDEAQAKPSVDREGGIIVPIESQPGNWERQSMPLKVSSHYKELFREFKAYFEKEKNDIGDNALSQELTVLEKLSN